MKKNIISKDMMIQDIVAKYPESAYVMMKHGLHCVGCHIAAHESLEQGAKAHGVSDKDIDTLVDEINTLINKSK